jgi:hypothetical protein
VSRVAATISRHNKHAASRSVVLAARLLIGKLLACSPFTRNEIDKRLFDLRQLTVISEVNYACWSAFFATVFANETPLLAALRSWLNHFDAFLPGVLGDRNFLKPIK